MGSIDFYTLVHFKAIFIPFPFAFCSWIDTNQRYFSRLFLFWTQYLPISWHQELHVWLILLFKFILLEFTWPIFNDQVEQVCFLIFQPAQEDSFCFLVVLQQYTYSDRVWCNIILVLRFCSHIQVFS